MMIQFGYWKAINRHFNFQDFFTNINTPSHLWLFSLQTFFNPWGFLPISVYGFFLFYIEPKAPKKFLASFSTISGLVVLMASAAYFFNQPNHVSFASSSFYRSMAQAAFAESDQRNAIREVVPTSENAKSPDKNIIFIIDESIKFSHMSLYGYERDTTPTLRKLHEDGKIVLWDDAIATTSCSVMSNAALISGIGSLPDTDRRVHKNPTIFQYAKAMGYTTHYYDGQFSRLWNGMKNDDLIFVDAYENSATLLHPRPVESDIRIAEKIAPILEDGVGHFFVVNKSGVHFPYEETFPESELIWSDTPPRLPNRNVADMHNAYDNGLAYNSETFFTRLLRDESILDNTVILYTSDHGQNLGEDEDNWSHCGDSKWEVQVPLFIIGTVPTTIDPSFKAHHFNIFSTLLDLMDVPNDLRTQNYPISLFEATFADSAPRYYLTGYLDFFSSAPILYKE
ncbi:MAG: sulfatase-like hydrolase/transferase [Chloroflexota bacterium]